MTNFESWCHQQDLFEKLVIASAKPQLWVHVLNRCMAKLQFFQETCHKQTLPPVDHTMSKNVSMVRFMVRLIQVRNSHIKTLNFVQVGIATIDKYHVLPFISVFFIPWWRKLQPFYACHNLTFDKIHWINVVDLNPSKNAKQANTYQPTIHSKLVDAYISSTNLCRCIHK